ncbi:NADH dehydrogenase [ubiquinone] 1 alpha subcomplex assembly factor 4 [Anguilla anguilla]|uniref:NADH dehydrogenase [ubiquinone] 1 alpha subcomplex assembly factor 4 n=1 Tax=Anguilla anguilla TaxID=7936 RepID=A0A0E9WNY2_ANGAN|nr:NADH dehydrogenase [ubiquinone] 1 alpha subcomplex assembly factor 4 [Anguilla anguilla]KAG5846725.1 hypothetical protein ANANG_G00118000 [Anguilla anguilla]
MGARVTRAFRNFNLENRAHREIGKAKPLVAPRHPSHKDTTEQTPEIDKSIHKKDDPLLSLLKSVYVESKDPPAQVMKQSQAETLEDEERRPLKFSLPGDPYGMLDITDVPKGKLSIVEALTALNNHKQSPKSWTPERIAQEYSLDLKDTKALLEFFVPFNVKIKPPKTEEPKQIKAT